MTTPRPPASGSTARTTRPTAPSPCLRWPAADPSPWPCRLAVGAGLRHARFDPGRSGPGGKGAIAGVSVVVVGLNQRTVPLDLLERMTVSETGLPKALADLLSRDHIT